MCCCCRVVTRLLYTEIRSDLLVQHLAVVGVRLLAGLGKSLRASLSKDLRLDFSTDAPLLDAGLEAVTASGHAGEGNAGADGRRGGGLEALGTLFVGESSGCDRSGEGSGSKAEELTARVVGGGASLDGGSALGLGLKVEQ